jgi:hypothetical protein
LHTAGAAAYGQPTGPGPVPAGASPKRKIPGVRGTESPDSFDDTAKKPRITCPFFSGEVQTKDFADDVCLIAMEINHLVKEMMPFSMQRRAFAT